MLTRGAGNIRIISISNTRNRTDSRKKRFENGIRAPDLGSKPHSYGLDLSVFSRSFILSEVIIMKISITMRAAMGTAIWVVVIIKALDFVSPHLAFKA